MGFFEGPEFAEAYFADVFPGAVVSIADVPIPEAAKANLRIAGFAMAEVLRADGTNILATYLIEDTPYSSAVDRIYDLEMGGDLPVGSHEQAIDTIIEGTFDDAWGQFMPRQQ